MLSDSREDKSLGRGYKGNREMLDDPCARLLEYMGAGGSGDG